MTLVPRNLSPAGACRLEGYYGALKDNPWCVYEHRVHSPEHPDGLLIYVGTCKLNLLYTFEDARKNSEWIKIVDDKTYLYVTVVYLGPATDCAREAMNRIRQLPTWPVCNLKGHTTYGMIRTIMCSNGVEYPTQKEAAEALGLNQGQISLHLNNKLKHVKGFTFSYKD